MISEGNSMNVLCIALGNPIPNVKLYVGGHFVREEKTRHLVTTIHNVTRDMTNVACYADNGERKLDAKRKQIQLKLNIIYYCLFYLLKDMGSQLKHHQKY